MDKIKVFFTINKVQNLSNGGYRLSMDIPSIHAKEAAMLLVYSDAPGVVGEAEITLRKESEEENTEWRKA